MPKSAAFFLTLAAAPGLFAAPALFSAAPPKFELSQAAPAQAPPAQAADAQGRAKSAEAEKTRPSFLSRLFSPKASKNKAKASQGAARHQGGAEPSGLALDGAKGASLSSLTLQANQLKAIKVRAPEAILRFKRQAGPYTFKGDWNWSFADGVLELSHKWPPEGLRGGKMAPLLSKRSSKLSAKPFELEAKGPGEASLSLFLLKGKVFVEGWKGPVDASVEEGAMSALKSQGDWNARLRQGSASFEEFSGSAQVNGFHTSMNIRRSKGEFEAQFNKGKITASESQGGLIYRTDKGQVRLKSWQGRLEGESISGSLRASLAAPSFVKAVSQTGDLHLRVLKSRPYLRARTEKGKIFAPKRLKKTFQGKAVSVKGRLPGRGPSKGSVSLTTESGGIYIR